MLWIAAWRWRWLFVVREHSGTKPPVPAHAGDLDATLAEAFRLLARGVADRRHGFHTPSLAGIGLDGAPQSRTVVLRGFDASARRLRFHTDARSAKVAEFSVEPRAALHLYDTAAQVQLRLSGRVTVHDGDDVADAAWNASRAMSRMIYATNPGPGTPIAAPIGAAFDAEAGRLNFRVLLFAACRLEWLWLAAAGHQRAAFAWDDAGACHATWLAP